MNRFVKRLVITAAIVGSTVPITAPLVKAAGQLDIESGFASSGYNDVRYPGTTGTLVSLSRDLTLNHSLFWRARVSYVFNDRHTLSVLAAPLRLKGKSTLKRDIRYGDVEFPAMTNVTTKYRFDSYRMTYRYNFIRRNNLHLGIGLTGKIRDAAISIEGGGLTSEKTNTGFVPLVSFRADFGISRNLGLILDGDALAAPQGRAEDVLVAITMKVRKDMQAKIGYRILEGGADNDEIYTFALVNYLVIGVIWQF